MGLRRFAWGVEVVFIIFFSIFFFSANDAQTKGFQTGAGEPSAVAVQAGWGRLN